MFTQGTDDCVWTPLGLSGLRVCLGKDQWPGRGGTGERVPSILHVWVHQPHPNILRLTLARISGTSYRETQQILGRNQSVHLHSLRQNRRPGFLMENYCPLENWTTQLLLEVFLPLSPTTKRNLFPFLTISPGNLFRSEFHSNITVNITSRRNQHLAAASVDLLWKSRCANSGKEWGR